MRTGGRILVDQLAVQGAGAAYLVPGESFLAVLDALFDSNAVRTIVCRHEGGAAMMAEAAGRLTGRPGIAFVTRAPGATNAASGVYVAAQGQTPMILFVGLPPRARAHLTAFQDFDVAGLYRGMAKHVEIASAAARLPETVSRAYAIALNGRPGPVVIGLPEDVLSETADVPDTPYIAAARSEPSQAAMDEIAALLAAAEQPIVIVGGPNWSAAAQEAVQAFALAYDLPVAAAFRAQDYLDNRHPSYCGHIGINMDERLATAIRAADLILVIGAPLDEIGTGGWTVIASPVPAQRIIHVHPGGTDPRDGVRVAQQIVASSERFALALASFKPPNVKRWRTFRRDLRAAFERSQRPLPTPGAVQFAKVVRMVSEQMPEMAIIASGAGNYSQFVHRYTTYKNYPSSLAPASGSMGYGLPAAIAAKIEYPERTVIAFAGDGCFMMTAQELATAVQYDLPIVLIIADNSMYGTIRMHQEKTYPGRVSGTSLVNPDFAHMARSFGAWGITVTETGEFEAAFANALAFGGPAVIVLKLDPNAITPGTTLEAFRKIGSARND
ncbi:MAG: thiamine pyrophosphate-dependent enzyme [Hyphomicrobium sp.]